MAYYRISTKSAVQYNQYEQTGYGGPVQTSWDVTFTSTPKVGDMIFYSIVGNSGKPIVTANSSYAEMIFCIDMASSSSLRSPLACLRITNVPTSNQKKASSYLSVADGWSGSITAVLLKADS